MKILHFIDSFQRGGGAEKFLLDLAMAENKISGVEIKILSLIPITENGFKEIVNEVGITVDILSDTIRSPKNFFKLWNYIRKNEFDVVHIHLFPALYYAIMCKFFQRKRPVLVYTEHSTNNRRRGKRIFKILDNFFYNKYDHIFAISDKVKEALKAHVTGLPITVINNGVDITAIEKIELVDIRKELGLPTESILLTMVSRFAWMKDYITVFKSIEQLPDNVYFLCVGDGEGMKEHQQIVAEKGLSDRIHFLGLRSDVIGIMKASDIIILSSKYEGFSISMLEAMACKKPFVASDVPGLNDNAAGVADFFKYQNVTSLASVLSRLIDDKKHYDDVALRCYEYAKKYNINKVAEKYINEIKKLL